MPHLTELVKLHSNQPFAVIGINARDTESAYRIGLERFAVTWISAYQGETRTPLSDLFRVRAYPYYVLLDHAGRIVEKGSDLRSMTGKLPGLIKAAKDKDGAPK